MSSGGLQSVANVASTCQGSNNQIITTTTTTTCAVAGTTGATSTTATAGAQRCLSSGSSSNLDKKSSMGIKDNASPKSGRAKDRKRNKNLSDIRAVDAKSVRIRLNHLFDQIEKEFDVLLSENLALKDRIDAMEEIIMAASGNSPCENSGKGLTQKSLNSLKRDSMVSASQLSQKIKSTYKMKTSGRIFNKTQSNMRATLIDKYEWHKDGVWFITTTYKGNKLYIATSSADGTACISDISGGKSIITPQITYSGHEGSSVNCIRFHPKFDLMLTASGDSGAHIWNPNLEATSDDEKAEAGCSDEPKTHLIKKHMLALTGHSSVVIACDWLSTVEQCVTASWDRTANIYDSNSGDLVVQLAGHDQELTDVNAHSSAPLIVTSSHDTTFRLWDFRDAIHSVSVFQGHTDCVTSATFLSNDKIVSGSDDKTVKVWDLKNMRSPLTSIHVEVSINKLGLSTHHNLIAIPMENRHVRLYETNGNRVCRLPRNHHERMVTCTTFAPPPPSSSISGSPNLVSNIQLLTCGFDRKVCLWSLTPNDHKS